MKTKPFKSLAGSLLVAKPALCDPNFFQTIVFLARHSAGEALGFVLNRPSGCVLFECVAPEDRKPWYDRVPVLRGGPVARQSLTVVSFRAAPRRGKISAHLDLPDAAVESELIRPNAWVRAFHGYAGWAGGQLERELREDSWELHPADRVYFDLRVAGGLWPFLIGGDDRWRELVDFFPTDPASN